jgi:DNA ligase-1
MSIQRRFFLSSLAAVVALPAAARPAAAVMLAQEAPPDPDPAGFLVSEKFDGVRALWDGERLRFRSGLPVSAPPWFTSALPPVALDGELWLARGRFEDLSGIVRRARPLDADWRALRYLVFDRPGSDAPFAQRARELQQLARQAAVPWLAAVAQQALPDRAALQARLRQVLDGGGEGLMLHRADARWRAGRSADLLKLKALADAEATVLAHLPGRGRHAGRLGALRVRSADGLVFDIGTGFSDAQRQRPPAPGQLVTYSYRGRTEAGVPRFAAFVRVREPGL